VLSSSRRAAWWPAALLVPLCAALYLPGLFTLPPVDRDEARYAQATRQMLESGDPVVPRLQDAPRLIKPIGIYWLQAAAVRLGAGTVEQAAIGTYRLPSVCGALLAALGTYWIGRRWFVAPAAWLGAAWLVASALLVVEAHLATTDAVLLACVVAAQACLAALYDGARRGRVGAARVAAGLWIAMALGILVKGPVAPLVASLTVLAVLVSDRRAAAPLLRALRPWWGVPLTAACVAPWALAVAARVGWRTVLGAMAGDIIPKLAGGHESHGGPPGLYLLMLPATFWPGSLALVFTVGMAWRHRRRPADRFLLAWLVPTWLVFELLPTKLPNYVLPTFPALALLAGRAALSAPQVLRPPLRHPVTRFLLIGWALLTIAIGLAPAAAVTWLGGACQFDMVIPTLSAAAIAVACLALSWRGALAAAACTSALAAAAVYGPLLQRAVPDLDALWLSRDAAAAMARRGPDRPLAAVGFAEPSLVFLTRSDLALLDAPAAAEFLSVHPDALLLVADDQLDAVAAAAQQRRIALRNLWSGRGFNYPKGRWTELQLFTAAHPPATTRRTRSRSFALQPRHEPPRATSMIAATAP
jgi:4-amino-4-deoxy-L-arabinose transferase-like glycosyltransferase